VPEGDTVWNTARVLERGVVGQELVRGEFRVPRLAGADVAGWRVAESASRGKHLLLRLTDRDGKPWTLHSHLRMDGKWRVYQADERWRGGPGHLIRVVLRTARAVAVGYHLHELDLVPAEREGTLVDHLGPDLLGPDWDAGEAVTRILKRPEREIADALLDQRNLAGIGNLYKSETLFLRGINPWRPVGEVPDLPGLVALAQRLLAANRGRWQQATTGSIRRGEEHWVFERAGSPCRRCGTAVRRERQGDHERISYWCPRCQPGEAPRGRERPTLARD
jgi:endonuclease VIII